MSTLSLTKPVNRLKKALETSAIDNKHYATDVSRSAEFFNLWEDTDAAFCAQAFMLRLVANLTYSANFLEGFKKFCRDRYMRTQDADDDVEAPPGLFEYHHKFLAIIQDAIDKEAVPLKETGFRPTVRRTTFYSDGSLPGTHRPESQAETITKVINQ